MTLEQSVNRTVNLVATTIVGLSGFAFAPEIISETEGPFKIDESLLLLLAIFTIGWYIKGKNKFSHSVVPIISVILAVGIKVMAVMIEFKDKEDIGDDFGGVVLFILATFLVIYLYKKSKRLIQS